MHDDFHLHSSNNGGFNKSYLEKLAKEEGYQKVEQIHWFKMTEGKVVPVGLEILYDGHPPGHCTLTVSRTMSVHEFLSLIEEHLGFDYIGSDVFGIR